MQGPPAFAVRDGRDWRLCPQADEWSAPAARIISISAEPIAANIEVVCWIAHPFDDGARTKAAEAFAAAILHGARKAGRISRDTIPDRLQADHWPKDERERAARRAEKRCARRVEAARLIEWYLLSKRVAGVRTRYSVDDALQEVSRAVAEEHVGGGSAKAAPVGDSGNLRRRLWRELAPVAHLAILMGKSEPCEVNAPIEWLVEAERTRRLALPLIGLPGASAAETWQFRPE